MKEFFTEHRKKAEALMEDGSIIVSYAGQPLHTNEDDYYDFEVNSQFFWLTGLEREGQILLITKLEGKVSEYLFIDEPDDFSERWTGKMPKKKDVSEVSGIPEESVRYNPGMDRLISRFAGAGKIKVVYFDLFRESPEDAPDYNAVKAKAFADIYPHIVQKNLHDLIGPLRAVKDEYELSCMRKAAEITDAALDEVLRRLRPGLMEYQVQTIFEASCRWQGSKKQAFGTIAGSGVNACSMHYVTNDCEIADGSLILLDLGAKYRNYCCDITRTYPSNGKFSERQAQVYSLVLKANKAVIEAAKPGTTMRELNDLTKKVLGEGLVEMGLIEKAEDVGKYYMHSVSHSLGVDVHDITVGDMTLRPGWVITDEPGLYIDEEGIGIRIEDDLLITENGCEVLTKNVKKEIADIEKFMAEANV